MRKGSALATFHMERFHCRPLSLFRGKEARPLGVFQAAGVDKNMNAKEFQTYWQELATGAGLSEDETKRVGEVLGNEKVSAAFVEKFMPVADHHRTLDKVKGESKTELDQAKLAAKRYEDWYKNKALPAHNQAKSYIDSLQKYRDLYGPLGENKKPDANGKLPDNVVTKEDLVKQFGEYQARMSRQTADLWETTAEIANRYQGVTGKPFPAKEFRSFAEQKAEEDRQNGRAPRSLDDYANEWMSPLVEEKQKAERTEWEKNKEQEIEQKLRSRLDVPPDTSPSEPHPFFSAPNKDLKDMDQQEIAAHRRQAFTTGWGEAGQS